MIMFSAVMGITVGCMASSMHVLPIGGDTTTHGPSQWATTGGREFWLCPTRHS